MSERESLRASLAARLGPLRLDVDFETGPGPLAVVGPNGAGKTSLLDLLLGVRPERTLERGRIALGERVLLDTETGVDVALEHRLIGYLPQDYALFPHFGVRENLAFAAESAPRKAEREARARRGGEILRELGLETLADRPVAELSGGEKQRVALARALMAAPRALLLDEPLAALDVHARREVRRFLGDYLRTLAVPTVVVTHDAADARALGNRILVLEAGKITQTGPWEELARAPASPFVAELVASLAPGSEARADP